MTVRHQQARQCLHHDAAADRAQFLAVTQVFGFRQNVVPQRRIFAESWGDVDQAQNLAITAGGAGGQVLVWNWLDARSW